MNSAESATIGTTNFSKNQKILGKNFLKSHFYINYKVK